MPMPDAPRSAEVIEAELNSLLPPNEVLEVDPALAASAAIAVTADEQAATRGGWLPKEQYKGDPEKWVDASTFLDRGRKFNKNLQREVQSLTDKLAQFQGTAAAFAKFAAEALSKKDAELQTAIKDLRIKRSEASADGDHEAVVALEDRIELLNEERKEVKKLPVEQGEATRVAGPKADDPVLLEWIEDGNEWFDTDPKLRAYAVALGEDLIKGGEKVRGRQFLDKVASRMAEEFPRKFKKAEGERGSREDPVGSGSAARSNGGGNGKTEADLPEADRALLKQYIKEGWTTKEKFLSSYFSR